MNDKVFKLVDKMVSKVPYGIYAYNKTWNNAGFHKRVYFPNAIDLITLGLDRTDTVFFLAYSMSDKHSIKEHIKFSKLKMAYWQKALRFVKDRMEKGKGLPEAKYEKFDVIKNLKTDEQIAEIK